MHFVSKFRGTSNLAILKIFTRKPSAALKAYQGYFDVGRENHGAKGAHVFLQGVSKTHFKQNESALNGFTYLIYIQWSI